MTLSRVLREGAFVAALLLVLEALVFSDYFLGTQTPPFDFLSAYNFEAYAWWHEGGLLNPPQWMPALWGGYPALTNVQNASYYLPIGLATLFAPYTLHTAAVVSALHAAFGAVGAYLLLRSWRTAPFAALLAAAAWFFAPGFFAQASHLDIMRAYAWAPWILLICSVHWPWRRWWGLPVAALLLSQAVLGSYPGVLVAVGYVGILWVGGQVLLMRRRPTAFLIPLAIAAACAIGVATLRYLPALATRGTDEFINADLSTFGVADLGTVLFPYDLGQFGSLMLFHSLFVPAAVIAGLAAVRLRDRLTILLAAVVLVCVLMGLPFWPWSGSLDQLPGLQLSRFRWSDFKVLALLGTVAIGARALGHLLTGPAPARRWRIAAIAAASVVGALMLATLGVVGIEEGFAPLPSIAQWVLLALSVGLVIVALVRSGTPVRWAFRPIVGGALILATVASGIISVWATPGFWRGDRVASETSAFGTTIDDLIAHADDGPRLRRPARAPVPSPDQPQDTLLTGYSSAYYTRVPSFYGYVNLRGDSWFYAVRESVDQSQIPAELDARVFWTAEGMLFGGAGPSPSAASVRACAQAAACGDGVASVPLSWNGAGTFAYTVAAARDTQMRANEAYYPGWTVTACAVTTGVCIHPAARQGYLGEVAFRLPKGVWTVVLDYRLPGEGASFTIAGLAVVIALAAGVVPALLRRRRAHGTDPVPSDPGVEVDGLIPGVEDHPSRGVVLEDPAEEWIRPRPDVP